MARGRHAEGARNDARMLEAAREVFTTLGADAPVAAVAERAGLGIASLYRRYGSKEELLQRLCLLAMEQTVAAAEAGLAEPDPWDGLVLYIRRCVEHRAGALAPVAGTIAVTPEMTHTAGRAIRLADELVGRAKTGHANTGHAKAAGARAAGALRPDVTAMDISLLVELFSRRAPTAAPAEDQVIRARLLGLALDGLRAPARTALPTPAPSPTTYTARWSAPTQDHDDHEVRGANLP